MFPNFWEQSRDLTRHLVLRDHFTVTYFARISEIVWEQFRKLDRILALRDHFTVTYFGINSEIIREMFPKLLGTIFGFNQDFSSSGPFYCTYFRKNSRKLRE